MEKKTFNTSKGPKAVGPYSTAVIYGDTVYMSGMIAIDPDTNSVIKGTVEDETHRVIKNIQTVLEEMNLSLSDVLKATIFLSDMNDFKAVNEIYKTYFGPQYPARSAVQVARLPLDVKIEIEVIARYSHG